MAVSMVPNEVWGLVFGELKDLGDFARAQAVSRTFQAIVLHKCWGQINRLHIHTSSNMSLVVNCGERKDLSSEKGLELLKQLSWKAQKITSLHLFFHGWSSSSTSIEILDLLASTSLKIQELELMVQPDLHNPFLPISAMAALFQSVAPTIKFLRLEINQFKTNEQLAIPPELQQAFDHCSSLETLRFRFFHRSWQGNLLKILLRGKSQLKNLEISCYDTVERLPEAILSSGASLLRFDHDICDRDFLPLFKAEVARRQLSTHPLQSVKELVLRNLWEASVVAVADHLDLFPQMDTLIDYSNYFRVDMVTKFLVQNRKAKGSQKELQWRMERGFVSPPDLVRAVNQRVECKVEFLEAPSQKRISFSKGNALVTFILTHF